MRRLWYVAALVVMAAPMWAQGPPGMPFPAMQGPPPLLFLLADANVQAELKITSAQNKDLKKVQDKQMASMQAVFKAPADQRQQKFEELMAATDKKTLAVLTASQKKRVKEIMFQLQGARAFLDPEIAMQLKLGDEQKAKLKEIVDDGAKQMSQLFPAKQPPSDPKQKPPLFQGKPPPPEVVDKKMEEIKKSIAERAHKLLNYEQESMWRELQGEPFKGLRFGPPGGMPGPPPAGFPGK
jgi:hypothetical protein